MKEHSWVVFDEDGEVLMISTPLKKERREWTPEEEARAKAWIAEFEKRYILKNSK